MILAFFTVNAAAEEQKVWKDPATGMEFVWVEGGCYDMGQTEQEKNFLIKKLGEEKYSKYYKNEQPLHKVCVDGFWMARYEVTKGQFRQFVKETGYITDAQKKDSAYVYTDANGWVKEKGYNWQNTGFPQDDSHPVTNISWNDARAFCQWLSGRAFKKYTLPSEAQWEYAARAGGSTEEPSAPETVCLNANGADQSSGLPQTYPCDDGFKFTAPVGKYQPNALGIHDMLGNVWEWCEDVFREDAYQIHSEKNPMLSHGNFMHVFRGGSWYNDPCGLRVSNRGRGDAYNRIAMLGFRVSMQKPVSGDTITEPLTGMEFVWVEKGCFERKLPGKAAEDICPTGFWMGKTEVTQYQWHKIMKKNPSYYATGKGTRPVENVSWSDCRIFASKLSELTGHTFNLPTETQWEYAARGGNKSKDYFYSGADEPNDVAVYITQSGRGTSDVGTKKPNELGLYDMSGNVWEWCRDFYDGKTGRTVILDDRMTKEQIASVSTSNLNLNIVIRGGGYDSSEKYLRVSTRHHHNPRKNNSIGLRLVMAADAGPQAGADQTKTFKNNMGAITVRAFPTNSRIRILNIKPKYEDGIILRKGKYHIEVSAKGYVKISKWVELKEGQDLVLNFVLKKEQ